VDVVAGDGELHGVRVRQRTEAGQGSRTCSSVFARKDRAVIQAVSA
jgi:hypothetical protein